MYLDGKEEMLKIIGMILLYMVIIIMLVLACEEEDIHEDI